MSLLPSLVLMVTLLSLLHDSQGFIFGKHGKSSSSEEKSHKGSKSKENHFGKSSSSEEKHEKPQLPLGPDDLNPEYFCQGPCKDGWISYLGFCHKYVSQKLTWKDAESHCQSLFSRAHLTSVLNENHNLFLMALAESQGSLNDKFWTGANSEKGSNSWADGSPLKFLKLPGNLLNKIFGGKLCLSICHGVTTERKLPALWLSGNRQPESVEIREKLQQLESKNEQ